MNKLKLASGVILVFLVGALAGSLGTKVYYKKRVEKFEAGGPPVQERIQVILGRFSAELDLTAEQKTAFEKIVKESQEKKVALGSKVQPEIKQINDDTFKSIKDKLTDKQKTKLETLIKRMEDVHDRFPSGPRQQERTPNQARPQGQSQDQVPPQSAPQQGAQQGIPGQIPSNPDYVQPKGGVPVAATSQEESMRFFGDLKALVNLTQAQEEKVKPVIESFFKEQDKVFEKFSQEKKDSSAAKTGLQETEKSFEKNLSTLLTPEQMGKYRKAKETGAIKLSPPDVN
jgi:hypothetical protein